MNINYKEQQFDLFPANSATLEDINKPKILLASLTLSTESLVILAILGIMIALFSFSLGVERGRSLAAQSLDEKVAAAWNVGGRRLATVAAVPAVVKPAIAGIPSARPFVNSGTVHYAALPHAVGPVLKAAPVRPLPASAVSAAVPSRWTVQVATYRNENFAQQEAQGLKIKGYPTFIVKSKDFYLVCVGHFGSQPQADAFSKKIQAKYQGQVRRF